VNAKTTVTPPEPANVVQVMRDTAAQSDREHLTETLYNATAHVKMTVLRTAVQQLWPVSGRASRWTTMVAAAAALQSDCPR
jgi:hypothetical protein